MKRLKDKQDTGVEALKKYYDGYMDYITLKYNPVLDAQPVSGIIGASRARPWSRGGSLREYDPLLDECGFSADDFGVLRKRIGDEDDRAEEADAGALQEFGAAGAEGPGRPFRLHRPRL